jgi:S-formylglutathione hydrolase FrmB
MGQGTKAPTLSPFHFPESPVQTRKLVIIGPEEFEMPDLDNSPRYKIETFHAVSLENNPPGSLTDRNVHIYLPPDYFQKTKRSYPSVYFLHGYAASYRNATVYPDAADKWKPVSSISPELSAQIHTERMASYHKFDEWILVGEVEPFIFIQPDGSLYLPHMKNVMDMMTGEVALKGSFYVNSPYTGNYESYIVDDVIKYIDHNFRTLAENKHRALAGSSMGGYGTLSICLNRPGIFSAAAALSPANFTMDSLSWKLRVPVLEKLLGAEEAAKSGDIALADILDTMDLVFSHDRPLLPTVEHTPDGRITSYDALAAQNWQKYDINNKINATPHALKNVKLLIDCDKNDEFGLADEALKLHRTLQKSGVPHEFDLYYDPDAALSPHQLGIAFKMPAAIKFCLQNIG